MSGDALEPPVETTEPTVEAPAATTEPAPTVAPPPPAGEPTVDDAAPPTRRGGFFVPTWLAAAVAGLLVFALGLGAGLLIGDHDDDHDGRRGFRVEFGDQSGRPGPQFGPGQGGRQNPFGGGRNATPNQPSTPTRPANPDRPSTPNAGGSAFIGIVPENSTDPTGVTIVRLQPAGPAARAGLKADDVITAIDGTKTDSVATLRSVLADHEPGDVLKITYTRDGKSATLEVTASDRATTPPQ